MWHKIISSTIILFILGCATPTIKKFEIKKIDTCIIQKTQAPQWACKDTFYQNNKLYAVSVIKSKKVTKFKKIKTLKIKGTGKYGHIGMYEKVTEPVNPPTFFDTEYYKLKAFQKIENRLNRYDGKVVDYWISPLGDFYELVEFEKN